MFKEGSVLFAGLLALFTNSYGMIPNSRLSSSAVGTSIKTSNIASIQAAHERKDLPLVIHIFKQELDKAVEGKDELYVSYLLDTVASYADIDTTDVLQSAFDTAVETRQFSVARSLLQASRSNLLAGYAFNQGLLSKSDEGVEFAIWLQTHPLAKIQYTPRYEDDVDIISYFLASAVSAEKPQLVQSVINETLKELFVYERYENLNNFLKYELDPIYNFGNLGASLLPSRSEIKDMFYEYFKKTASDSTPPSNPVNTKKINSMKRLISAWANGKE